MKIFLLSLGGFALCVVLLAIGQIVAKKELKGSCGGMGRVLGLACWFCPQKKCEQKNSDDLPLG